MDAMDDLLNTESSKCQKNISTFNDDGSLDWYMRNGPIRKSQKEMTRRRESDENKAKKAQEEALKRKRIIDQEVELQEKESAKLIELPSWSDSIRCVPNSVLRGSLFAAIHEKNAELVEKLEIHRSKSLVIQYSGKRLTQADLDVWEYCLHLVKGEKLGHRVYLEERDFLSDLGRKPSGYAYRWLRNTLDRLFSCGVKIENNDFIYGGSMLQEYYYDKNKGKYFIVVNPRIGRLYSAGHTYVNWEERQKIGNKKPLALWLHGYISSHSKWVPHSIECIKSYSGTGTSDKYKFKQNLKNALEHLLDLKLIKEYSIDRNGMINIKMTQKGEKKSTSDIVSKT